MRALLLLPIQRLILTIWLWITEHLFHRKGKRSALRTTLAIGTLCAGSLLLYPYLVGYIGLDYADYTMTSLYPSVQLLGIFLLYLLVIITINHGASSLRAKRSGSVAISWNNNQTTSMIFFLKEILLRILILWWGYLILGNITIAPIFVYYLLVAASEEGLKYLSSISLYKKRQFTPSDLILFAMLTALGFAFIENIIYMLQHTQSLGSIGAQLAWGTTILISRWFVWFLVHLLFTGTIAYLSVLGLKRSNSLFWLFGALIVGILLHMSYNILLHYNITFAILLYLLAGYFLLSWLFYKSDGVYLES